MIFLEPYYFYFIHTINSFTPTLVSIFTFSRYTQIMMCVPGQNQAWNFLTFWHKEVGSNMSLHKPEHVKESEQMLIQFLKILFLKFLPEQQVFCNYVPNHWWCLWPFVSGQVVLVSSKLISDTMLYFQNLGIIIILSLKYRDGLLNQN